MIKDARVTSWRAIEALRAGVPNRDAVQALGSSQPVMEERFRQVLSAVQEKFAQGEAPEGIIFSGDFGSGKSHLLEYLRHVALENNFVCSKVVVSKETPLCDPVKIFRAAIESAEAPEWAGSALSAVAHKLDFDSPEYQRFYQWVFSPNAHLNPRFPASVLVFQQGKGNRYPEISDRILRFWGGAGVPERDMRDWLDELGEESTFKFGKVTERDLVWQRYQFLSQLLVASGFSGWILLVDEVELIGRYSFTQRARSYAEAARLLGAIDEYRIPGFASALAITSAYQSEVMDEKQDEERIANGFGSSEEREDLLLAVQAHLGVQKIRQIPQENMVLADDIDLREIFDKCRSVYGHSYEWTPPEDFEVNPTWRIRQHIKRWINTWDLLRLFEDIQPQIQVNSLEQTYTEDPDLEKASRGEPEEQDEGDGVRVQRVRPKFVVLGGGGAHMGRIFAPERRITQVYGDPVYDVEWRWCVPGFDMPWQFASGPNLKDEPLVWEFDQNLVGNEKWEHLSDDQLGIELRFQWQNRWRRELHRFPLTHYNLVDGKTYWKIGTEILPPITYDE